MASAEQIAELRRLINEFETTEPWTDAALGARIDATDDITALAATIWREKAATYAGLVDMKEGNSDRKLSQLYKQALDMSAALGGGDGAAGGRRPAMTRPIERM
jgi:hypothetical protein